MKDHVIQSKIAVKNAAAHRDARNIARQPIDQRIHRRYLARGRRAILTSPKTDLPRHEAVGSTERLQTDGRGIDGVQLRYGLVHRIEYPASPRGIEIGQPWVPENPALYKVHHVERDAQHAGVLAHAPDPGDWHTGCAQGSQHSIF